MRLDARGTRHTDLYVFAGRRVPPSGSALIDAHGAVTLDELQRAESGVVVGEPREDGKVEPAACGDHEQRGHHVGEARQGRPGLIALVDLCCTGVTIELPR